jgi:putative sugar ABC transporter, periplasmic sugar-binding protein
MRKAAKKICFVLALLIVMSAFTGCFSQTNVVTLTIGLPFDESDTEKWEALEMIRSDFEGTGEFKLEVVRVPDDAEGKTEFLRSVNSGSIDMFYYTRDAELEQLIEDEKIATFTELRSIYPALYEMKSRTVIDISTDSDGVNRMLPTLGEYQGLFINTEVFKAHNIGIPQTWDQLLAAIDTFNAAGVTPIAAGFQDRMDYWIDELIMMEGGAAEHSYIPKYGVVNSWVRAVNDLQDLYNRGAFGSDSLNTTHETALQNFYNGSAAMILTSSRDLESAPDIESIRVASLPVTSTGKKNFCDFIGDYCTGFYITSGALNKSDTAVTLLIDMFLNYIDANEYEMDFSYDLFKTIWSMPPSSELIETENEGSRYYPQTYEDESGDIIEVDPSMDPIMIDDSDTYDDSLFYMMHNATLTGRSLTTEFKTFDVLVQNIKDVITGNKDVNTALNEATQAEVAAQNAGDVAEGEAAENTAPAEGDTTTATE